MYSLYGFFVFPFSNVYSNVSEPRENPTFLLPFLFSISFSPLLSFPFSRPIVKLSQYGNRFFSVCRFETLGCHQQEESGFRSEREEAMATQQIVYTAERKKAATRGYRVAACQAV